MCGLLAEANQKKVRALAVLIVRHDIERELERLNAAAMFVPYTVINTIVDEVATPVVTFFRWLFL